MRLTEDEKGGAIESRIEESVTSLPIVDDEGGNFFCRGSPVSMMVFDDIDVVKVARRAGHQLAYPPC
jgi:hypothetical protein